MYLYGETVLHGEDSDFATLKAQKYIVIVLSEG